MYKYIKSSKDEQFMNLDNEEDMLFLEKTLKKLQQNNPDYKFEIDRGRILGHANDGSIVRIPLYAIDGRNKSTLYRYLEYDCLGYAY